MVLSEIKKEQTNDFAVNFQKNEKHKALQRTVVRNGIMNSAENIQESITPVFSIDLGSQPVANQKQTSRCWLFAALNTFRRKIEKEFKLKDFELSQSYPLFWDKLEKANYFYENILESANEPLDSLKVDFLLATPQPEGGQWEMAVALFQKYGVVPKSAMPESAVSSNTKELNQIIDRKLRKDAITLRQLANDSEPAEKIQQVKESMLEDIYNILSISLGTPPEVFDFEYADENKQYHIEQNLTPNEFYEKYIGIDLTQYANLINAPTSDKPYMQTYSVQYLGNIVGAKPVSYLNTDMETLKKLAVKQLESGEPVWFSCDVNQSSSRKRGIMSLDTYNMAMLFDIDFTMSKAQRLETGESFLTHAMLLTGADLIDGKPVKWKVENTWGDKAGDRGYFTMTDEWMDAFVFQVIIKKSYLTPELLSACEKKPVLLSPWDCLR